MASRTTTNRNPDTKEKAMQVIGIVADLGTLETARHSAKTFQAILAVDKGLASTTINIHNGIRVVSEDGNAVDFTI